MPNQELKTSWLRRGISPLLAGHSGFSKAGIPAVPPQTGTQVGTPGQCNHPLRRALLPHPWSECLVVSRDTKRTAWLSNRAGFSLLQLRSMEPVGRLLDTCSAGHARPLQKLSLHLASSSCQSVPVSSFGYWCQLSPFLPWHRQMDMMETYMDHSPWVDDLAGFV